MDEIERKVYRFLIFILSILYMGTRLIAQSLIQNRNIRDSFYIYDMNKLRANLSLWKHLLPMVHPYFAIKCNPNPQVLKYLAESGTGFDCASKNEIEQVLKYTSADKIIFAHPVKKETDIQFANKSNIPLTTIDSVSELKKLASVQGPTHSMDVLLRIRIDNPSAKVQLGLKYGATEEEIPNIISTAKSLYQNIRGVSFHVGSASKDPQIFAQAIESSFNVLKAIRDAGFTPSLLDIGGGFTVQNFQETAAVIRNSLADTKHQDISKSPFRIIAEPGRYFVEDIAHFYTPIIGKRTRGSINEYWITDGLYGSLNCILYDRYVPQVNVLRNDISQPHKNTIPSIIFGASCDSEDRLNTSDNPINLPDLEVGDYLEFPNFGAYTIAAATDFNGINMTKPRIFYI